MKAISIHEKEDEPSSHHRLLVEAVQETLSLVATLKQKTFVVKLGGSALEYQRAVLQDLIWLHDLGVKVVLVHGGGPSITAWLQKLHIPTRFEQGQRVTDAQTLEVVRMVLCGHINRELVALTTEMGGDGVGLCGTDGHMIQAHVANERLGLVGEIDTIDASLVLHLVALGYIPIIAPLGLGANNTCLNINADLVASRLAGALKADRLIFLSDVNGIHLPDGTNLAELDAAQATALIAEGIIYGGMIPKIKACLQALADVPRVHIVSGAVSHALLSEIEGHSHMGTTITR
ncbi:acetylglutamate kinase [Ktedonosporobacter rubrisoli]|uniref:Acetylglutamate kinase n=1 Tax=Ktedonosporobacter rubrisoli TaxID=2509675 RepID=A0A4P6JPG0_KTERU|nr:acetylglutamate kinase [Ktedonosporobacter rubrisoli]QBD76962.1 acetylglutamate kinase [Ktedonosporobacter rubrisoli]